MLEFHLNPDLDIPLYRQLVDMIQTAIKKGQLTSGQKLPTVQEMSQNLSIARGTIKRAYDELERKGLLEKVQGRGTFVSFQPVHSGSRKEQAMEAIDTMLNQLESMGLSPSEINIFLNLKLRERAEQESKVKVVLVADCPENLDQMAQQIRQTEGVDLYSYLLESIQQYPYKLGEDFDLLVSAAEHAAYLQGILPGKKKMARVALRLSEDSLMQILRIPKEKSVGIVAYSGDFLQALHRTCEKMGQRILTENMVVYSPEWKLEDFFHGVDVVLVPQGYERYFGSAAMEILRKFHEKIIPCCYEMDDGSWMHLESKLRRLLDAKTL